MKDLSISSGVSHSHISLIENGKRSPTLDVVQQLSKGLDIPASVLLMIGSDKGEFSGDQKLDKMIKELIIKLLSSGESSSK